MRVLVATVGSEGDIRPFIAFARELHARGHEVLFSAPDRYARHAAEQGLAFRKHGPPWCDEEIAAAFARVLAASNPVAQLGVVMDFTAEQGRQALPELLEMVAQVDVVVYPPILVAAAAAARAKGIPHVSAQLAPVHRSRHYAPTGSNFGPLLNGVAWSLATWTLRRASDAKLNVIVEAAGLAPWRNVLIDASSSSLLDLVAASPLVVARDPAWPASSHVTGYWFLDEPQFVPDPALAAFVEGEPPVAVGFGSMVGFDAQATTRTLLAAVRDLRCKVILQAGWARLGAADLPPHVHVAKFVPHDWLFARSACVVHHGGAGTTAAALRAGIPQTIVWHLGDQPIWAKKAIGLGVSPATVSRKKLRAPWLRAQIERMRDDRAMQTAARALGAEIQKENGLALAADLLEQTFSRRAAPTACAG